MLHKASYPKVRDDRRFWRIDRQALIAQADTLLGIRPKTRVTRIAKPDMGNMYSAPVWVDRPIDPTVRPVTPWVK